MAEQHGRDGRPVVLLIGDNAAQRTLEWRFTPDFQSCVVQSEAEGLTAARRVRPDIIVLDVARPGMDGWDFRTQLKRDTVTAQIPATNSAATRSPRRLLSSCSRRPRRWPPPSRLRPSS